MRNNFLPNLPDRDVKVVVMSTISDELVNNVKSLGIDIIPSSKIEHLLQFEKYHSDMQIFHYNRDTVFVLKECTTLQEKLKPYFKNIILPEKCIERKYPDNVLLNCVSIDDKIICNSNTIDNSIKKEISDNKVFNVNQGYTKCSTCVVSNDAIITSDKSIWKATRKDFDVIFPVVPTFIIVPETVGNMQASFATEISALIA